MTVDIDDVKDPFENDADHPPLPNEWKCFVRKNYQSLHKLDQRPSLAHRPSAKPSKRSNQEKSGNHTGPDKPATRCDSVTEPKVM
jgi:hypothetical protein